MLDLLIYISRKIIDPIFVYDGDNLECKLRMAFFIKFCTALATTSCCSDLLFMEVLKAEIMVKSVLATFKSHVQD